MDTKLNTILKVFLLSAALAFAIKYLAPGLNIPATAANALIAILLPSTVMAIALVARLWQWKGMEGEG